MILTIFGSTGDLAKRMLFPSLYHLFKSGRLPDNLEIVAVGRRDYNDESFRDYIEEEFKNRYKNQFSHESWERFSTRIKYFLGDLSQQEDFEKLSGFLAQMDESYGECRKKIFYLAISPDLYLETFRGIKESTVTKLCDHGEHVSVVVEKPFGRNLSNFYELNNQLLEVFDESQIYRIDHYLGKDTVRNILYFRAANPIFFNDWSNNTVDKVEVKVSEDLGVGSRATYYDHYGQLRDLVQSHSLQLLALVLAEIPNNLESEAIIQAKLEILENLSISDLSTEVVRGQYTAGVVGGEKVKGYREEHPDLALSETETYARVKALVNLPKWQGVEIVLISGKRMQSKETSITLHFKSQERVSGITSKNKLVFRIQPQEGISLDLQVKRPGTNELDVVPMLFKYEDNYKGLLPDAYESLLLNIFEGKKSSFISTAELEASWKFIDPIVDYWREQDSNGLMLYPAGSKEV